MTKSCPCGEKHSVVGLVTFGNREGVISFCDGYEATLTEADIDLLKNWWGKDSDRHVEGNEEQMLDIMEPSGFLLWCYEKGLRLSDSGREMNIREVYALVDKYRGEKDAS